jgi:hypothetical protein
VTLVVDEHAQDLVTVATMRTADRSTTDPVRRTRHNHRATRIIPDKIQPWDFDSGGGVIPQFVLEAGLWSVVRVPAATAGTVVEIDVATTDDPSVFAIGVFNQPITPAMLISLGLSNPLFDPGDGTSAWDNFPTNKGLVIGWGQAGDACGYGPYSEGQTPGGSPAPVTGKFTDTGSWDFQSLIPPWLWVAIYSPYSCTVSGRLYPQAIDQ